MFDWEHGIALHAVWGNLPARWKSRGFSHVTVGTWGIFSS